MNPEWRQFLQQQGAVFEEKAADIEVSRFEAADAELEIDNRLTAITPKGVIAVTGADAKKFLQGQVTCNLDEVDEGSSVLGALCNYQGKTICTFRLLLDQDTYYLILHASLAETVITYLNKYIAFSKAKMSDVSDQFVHIGCWGKQAGQLLNTQLAIPDIRDIAENGTYCSKLGVAIRIADPTTRIEFMSSTQNGIQLWNALSRQCEKVPSKEWMLLDIRNGIPQINIETSEQFIPQMLNLDLIGAISFKKGCYTGQEIIARSHYLGKQKRRLFRLQAPSGVVPVPGQEVYFDGKPQPAGKVINTTSTNDGKHEFLAVVKAQEKVQKQTETLYFEPENGEKICLLSLPYAIPIE